MSEETAEYKVKAKIDIRTPISKKRFFLRSARSRAPFFNAAETEKVNVYQGSGRESIR